MSVNNNSPVNGGNGSAPPPAVAQQNLEGVQNRGSLRLQRVFSNRVENSQPAGPVEASVSPTRTDRIKQEWTTTEVSYAAGLKELVRVIDLALNATDGTLNRAIACQQEQGREVAATPAEVRERLTTARDLYKKAYDKSEEIVRILQNPNMADGQKIDAVELLLGSYAAAITNISVYYEPLKQDLNILDSVVGGRVLFPKQGNYRIQDVAGLAITPVQRMPRHEMLLRDYAGHVESRELLNKVLALQEKFAEEARSCNEIRGEPERQCRIALDELRDRVSDILSGSVDTGVWEKVTAIFNSLSIVNFYGDEAAKKEACELRASVFEKNLKRLTGIRGFFARWQIRRLSKRDLEYRRLFEASLEHQGKFIAKMQDKGWMTAQKAAELQRIIVRGSGW